MAKDVLYIGVPYSVEVENTDKDTSITANKIMPVLYDKPSKKRYVGRVKSIPNTNDFVVSWSNTKSFSPATYVLEIYRISSGAVLQPDGSYMVTDISSVVVEDMFENGYIENWCVAKTVSISS